MTGNNSQVSPRNGQQYLSDAPLWHLPAKLGQALSELNGQGVFWLQGLEGSALAFALARAWLRLARTWLLVTPTLASAERMARDLEFFLAGLGGHQAPVQLYPDYEVSPYQDLDPPPEVTARRMAVLWELLAQEAPLLVVAPASALSGRVCPPEYLVDRALAIKPGLELEREALTRALVQSGYSPVSLVEQAGEFAIRGSVVDFFGPVHDEPIRVEFFGDTVESLRSFDPGDQRSQLAMRETTLIPCHPCDLSPEAVERAAQDLRELSAAQGFSGKKLAELMERVELGSPFTGLENLLPLYHRQASDLFAYLPEGCLRALVEPAQIAERLKVRAEDLERDYEEAREEGRVALPPAMLRRTPAQINQRLQAGPRILARGLPIKEADGIARVELSAAGQGGLHQELSKEGEGSLLSRFIAWSGARAGEGRDVFLICRSRSQVDRLAELFAERELAAKVCGSLAASGARGQGELFLLVGGLSAGFTPADAPACLVTEDEVFGAPRVVRQKAPPRLSEMLAALDDLGPGDLVVHLDHGIGLYQGLVSLAVGAAESDFLLLTYADGDKLYLPADRMGLISKYRGPGDVKPPLDRLGGHAWIKVKGRVKKAVEAIARDLVELYAARSIQKGHSFAQPDREYREFEAGFPYQETLDQAKAIEEVMADLAAPRPMDRLICGDVGYGKTEVALRASYLAAMQGKQVAFLVPTTVLAEQHFQTFAARLKDQPLVVESLSRFKTQAQQNRIIKQLGEGKVDIVIGTHRLIQKDVVFKDLGLVVLDEEHRFGVKDKEKLKKLRKTVDVLALTATPIPRTMQMSLSGIRDLSLINTPPEDRQAIKTYLAPFSPQAAREAIKRELARGGQVFFVHNRVRDITRVANMVKTLVPEARVGVAHGQMAEKSLEKTMLAFVRRELDVLVCTTIIESGLDIPSANTIIIHRAEMLGLSQIYQLRGRVGRAGERAYAYLFIKSETSLSGDARKRLKALMDFTHLGAGFAIAMHDLQIRGAGNLLGEAQSGRVAEVGYELYVQMLEEAVARLSGQAPAEGPEPELRLSMPAMLPEKYVPDPQVRLSLYRRLSRSKRSDELVALAGELCDRFGPLPQAARNLLDAVELKGVLRALAATRLDLSVSSLKVHFAPNPRVDLDRLLGLAAREPQKVRVYPDGQVSLNLAPDEAPFERAKGFLQYIGGDGT